MSTGSFPEIKRPESGIDYPHPSSAEVKDRVELQLYSSPLGLLGLFYGKFAFNLLAPEFFKIFLAHPVCKM
jgi:hypothetical protein